MRIIFIAGLENSGTKILAKILESHKDIIKTGAGNWNSNIEEIIDKIDKEKFEEAFSGIKARHLDDKTIIIRRSIPHGGRYYNIENFKKFAEKFNIKFNLILTSRDVNILEKSQLSRGYAKSKEHFLKNYSAFFDRIENFLDNAIFVSLESLYFYKIYYINFILRLLKLDPIKELKVKLENPNLKYLRGII